MLIKDVAILILNGVQTISLFYNQEKVYAWTKNIINWMEDVMLNKKENKSNDELEELY